MFQPFTIFLATRYVRSKQKNRFISLIGLISVIGMGLGVAVLILVLSVMNGADLELRQRILGMVPHAVISGRDDLSNWNTLRESLLKIKGVKAAAPMQQMQSMLTAKGEAEGSLVTGIVPSLEKDVSIINQFMVDGDFNELKPGKFNIVLGAVIARQMGVRVNDSITLIIPETRLSPVGVLPRLRRFTVVGIFEVRAEVDAQLAFIHLEDANRLLRLNKNDGDIRLKLNDLFQSKDILRDIHMHNEKLYGYDWTRTHGTLFSAIRMEKTMIGLLLFLIVTVAIFNIISSLVMLVTDKRADIAILLTMGATPVQVQRIFLWQGLMIAGMGISCGTVIGILAALNVTEFFLWIEKHFHLGLFDAYFINYMPSELLWSDVILVVSVATVLSALGAIYPARKAASVQPVEVLRYE